jgi:hypothetical protein
MAFRIVPASNPRVSTEVALSRDQFITLEQSYLRIDAVRRLLNAADFHGCECENEIRSARLLMNESIDALENLYRDMSAAIEVKGCAEK